MTITELTIQTADKISLAAILFEPKQTPKAIILLTSGLGVPKGYYVKYAKYLCEQDYTVLIYDNRGLGEAHLKIPESDKINLRNWAQQDMVAMIAYCKEKYPQLKLYAILHSVGGQILGLVKNHQLLERVVLISAMGGHWRDEAFPLNLSTWYMWYIHIPLLTWIFGYLPKGLTYRGVAIAKGVAQEWASWGRKADYIKGFWGKTIQEEYYSDIKLQMDAIWFTDDVFATKSTIASILDLYTHAQLTKRPINPLDYDLKKIGHSGFFSSKSRGPLWQLPLDILAGKEG